MTSHHLSPIARDPSEDPTSPERSHALTPLQGTGGGLAPWTALPEEDEGLGLRTYLSALYRGRWAILLALLLGGAGWAGYALFLAPPPEYVAEGRAWIQGEGSTGATGPIVTGELLESSSWVDLLRAYTVLDSVVVEQRLFLRPQRAEDLEYLEDFRIEGVVRAGTYRLRPDPEGAAWVLQRDRETLASVTPGSTIGEGLGFRWSPPAEAFQEDREVTFQLASLRDAARRLRGELDVSVDQRGSFLSVAFHDLDPERASNVVNSVLDRFVAVAADLKRRNLDAEADLLREQLLSTEAELAAHEQALEAFRVRTITLPSDQATPVRQGAGLQMTRDPVFDEFFELNAALEAARRDRERLEAIVAAIPEQGLQLEALNFIPTAEGSGQLQEAVTALLAARTERRALLDRYTEEHPLVVEATERINRLERGTIPFVLDELIQQLRAEESGLSPRIQASASNLSQIPERTIQEAGLQRNVDIAEELYGELQRRYQVASLARASSIPDVSILDRAVPPDAPVEEAPFGVGLVILIGCLGAAVVGVLVRDRINPRIRTPDEVLHAFGLPVLGAVPRIQGGRDRRGGPVGIRNLPQVREAFRQLRTSLEYAYGSAGPMVVTISSSSMDEGKTLVTTNLGVSFAELGLRTVVVDADTRRGDLHHFLGGRRTPGLTDFLQGSVRGDDILQSSAHDGLDFIGSGTRVPNSPELLASSRMGDLLASLRKMYDVILVDSPPLGAGADPLVLGSITGHMVFVVRSGSTERDFAMAKLEPLERLPIRVMGVVLNDYVPDRISAYRHYGSYLPGYETRSESEEKEDRMIAGVAAGSEG